MKIGITGSIGSGKSYLCKRLALRGIEVYDCDSAAKRLMRDDGCLQSKINEAVGQEVFHDGIFNKTVLSAFLLKSDANAKIIDSIVHPAVFDDFTKSGMQWVESAILFECGMDKLVDKTICVVAPLEVRIERIMKRDGITREMALEWINRQMSQAQKLQLADIIIINDGVQDIECQINEKIKI